MVEVNNFKPKEKGTPRGSRNKEMYENNLIPFSHLKLLNGIKTALGGEGEGELVFQRVLDLVKMYRSSALKAIKYLEKYGYLKYEAKQHKVFIKILEKENDKHEINK